MSAVVPLPKAGVREGVFTDRQPNDHRLATCRFATGSRVIKGGEAHTLIPEGCDLSGLVEAPLLIQHSRYAEDMIGLVEEAKVVAPPGQGILAIVRFARRPKADEFYSMLLDGMPLACSYHYDVLEAEEAPDHRADAPHWIVRHWRPDEISVVAAGADRHARIVRCGMDQLVALSNDRRAERLERERAERLEALRADAWRTWAAETAPASLAVELGVPSAWVSTRLARLVDDHLGQLEDAVRIFAEAKAEA